MSAIHLSAEKFDDVINSGKTVLVDFWATWCRPCMMMGPVVDEIADDYKDKAIVCKVDVDSAQEIAAKLGVMNIPNFKIFKDGKEVQNIIGAVPKKTLSDAIDKAL